MCKQFCIRYVEGAVPYQFCISHQLIHVLNNRLGNLVENLGMI